MHYASEYFQPVVKVRSLTFSDFLSNVGGFMGLLAGISVLSIVEIFYHILKQCRKSDTKVYPIAHAKNPTRSIQANQSHALFQLTQYLVVYTKTSDLHGLKYASDKNESTIGNILWTVLVILSVLVCSGLVKDIYEHAEKSPVATFIESRKWTLDDVRFRRKAFFFIRWFGSFADSFPVSGHLSWFKFYQVFDWPRMFLRSEVWWRPQHERRVIISINVSFSNTNFHI